MRCLGRLISCRRLMSAGRPRRAKYSATLCTWTTTRRTANMWSTAPPAAPSSSTTASRRPSSTSMLSFKVPALQNGVRHRKPQDVRPASSGSKRQPAPQLPASLSTPASLGLILSARAPSKACRQEVMTSSKKRSASSRSPSTSNKI